MRRAPFFDFRLKRGSAVVSRVLALWLVLALVSAGCSGDDASPPEPDLDALSWSVYDSWAICDDAAIRVSALATTGELLIAGGLDTSGAFCGMESTDAGESWASAAGQVTWSSGPYRGESSDSVALLPGRVEDRAAVYIIADHGSTRDVAMPDGGRPEESAAVAARAAGDVYVVVGNRGSARDDIPVVWRSENAGESWEDTVLPTEPGVRGGVTSIDGQGNVLVVGGYVERRDEEEAFGDGSHRKPVVWVSLDDCATWSLIELDSSTRPVGRVQVIAAVDSGFRAIGWTSDLHSDPEDTPNVVQWSSSGDLEKWVAAELVEQGRQGVSTVVENTTDQYVVGWDWAGDVSQLVIWKSGPDGLERVKLFEPFEGDVWIQAGAVRVGERWFLAGTRQVPTPAFTDPSVNWLVVGEP